MDSRFSLHLETWLTALLRQKALATATDGNPAAIGAADLSIMFSDYLLETLGGNPRSCLNCCGLEDVTDREILDVTGFDREVLAAAFIGAVVDLSPWMGSDGIAFLMQNGVLEEDAIEFTHAVEIAAEKLGTRGQALVAELSGRSSQSEKTRQCCEHANARRALDDRSEILNAAP
jgi:hypothetical protein